MAPAVLKESPISDTPLEELKKNCEAVASSAPGDTQKIASLLSKMILNYYEDVRKQAQQSFYCALVAAVLGTLFFIYATWLAMEPKSSATANISLIGGALIQVISGINFYMYARASRQFGAFHICLERTNRFLLGNTLCENLNCPTRRDEMRSELIKVVANAPMLTMDIISEGRPRTHAEKEQRNA